MAQNVATDTMRDDRIQSSPVPPTELKNSFVVNQRISVDLDQTTVRELYNLRKDNKLISMPRWLQRLRQAKKWQGQKNARALSYLQGLVDGEGVTCFFYHVKIDVLIKMVKRDMEFISAELSHEIFADIIKELQHAQKDGATHVCLDGQNRLDFAILPFFDSSLTYSTLPDGASLLDIESDKVTPLPSGFKFEDLSEEKKTAFWNISVVVAEVTGADNLERVVRSLININNNISWTPFEVASVELVPLNLKLVTAAEEDPIIGALFGNGVNVNGQIKDASSSKYAIEKKGNLHFFVELIWYTMKKGAGGFGGSANVCKTILKSKHDDDPLKAWNYHVKPILEFISNSMECVDNPDLIKKNKPFTIEALRTLFITLSMMTDARHSYKDRTPVFLKGTSVKRKLSCISSPQTFIEDMVNWHNDLKDRKLHPELWTQTGGSGKYQANPNTFAWATRGLSDGETDVRSDHIVEFLAEKDSEWKKNNMFTDYIESYTKSGEALKKKQGHKDGYTGKRFSLRSSIDIDHVKAVNGPDKGTDAGELRATNPKSNKIKSNKH